MSTTLSGDSRQAISEIAAKHGFGDEAATALAEALLRGGGQSAQFSHPELGGMGQWSQGGMLMIGDMFNDQLKGRVSGLAGALADAVGGGRISGSAPSGEAGGSGHQGPGGSWWPAKLGSPSSSGAQNGRRYAVFPDSARLVVDEGGRVTVYDTGDHRIQGASQGQGSDSSLRFASQKGSVRIDDLPVVDDGGASGEEVSAKGQAEAASPTYPTSVLGRDDTDVVDTIRRLSELRDAGILSEAEFGAKKADLLARL